MSATKKTKHNKKHTSTVWSIYKIKALPVYTAVQLFGNIFLRFQSTAFLLKGPIISKARVWFFLYVSLNETRASVLPLEVK